MSALADALLALEIAQQSGCDWRPPALSVYDRHDPDCTACAALRAAERADDIAERAHVAARDACHEVAMASAREAAALASWRAWDAVERARQGGTR